MDFDLFLRDIVVWVIINLVIITLWLIYACLHYYFKYQNKLGKNAKLKKKYIDDLKRDIISKEIFIFSFIISSGNILFYGNLFISRVLFGFLLACFLVLFLRKVLVNDKQNNSE